MPPAFNLSQDQTLQFNLCVEASRLPRSFERSLTLRKLTDQIRRSSHVLLCEHCITCEATLSEDSSVRYPAPTLIGCLVVKEPALSLPSGPHPALPFASLRCQQRERDYAALSSLRQPFQQLFLLRPARQLRCANPPGRPRNPCCVCFAALRCVARGRILSDRRGVGKGFLKTSSCRHQRPLKIGRCLTCLPTCRRACQRTGRACRTPKLSPRHCRALLSLSTWRHRRGRPARPHYRDRRGRSRPGRHH